MSEKKCRYCSRMISKYSSTCPLCNKKQGLTSTEKLVGGIVLFSIILVVAIYSGNPSLTMSSSTSESLSPKETALTFQRKKLEENPAIYIKVIKQSWYKSGFDTVAMHNITLKNESELDVKDIVIKFSYASDSGTLLDTNTYTLYKSLPKGKTKTFTNLNVGFVHSQATRGAGEIFGVTLQ